MKWLEKTVIMLILSLVAATMMVSAQPTGVDEIEAITSSRANLSSITPTSVDAQAGNVTQLSLNGTAITSSWQGFYGNISGTLILSDNSGNNFYDWNMSTPSGEVYASRVNNVDWSQINCASGANITAEETALGQQTTDPDSVTNTFTSTLHPDFMSGTTNITGCQSTQAYDSTGGPGTGFWQILLSDTSDIVYSTIIDSDTGFNNLDWDFQLLVGEDGHNGDTTLTPYYFYVELQ